MAGKHSNKIVFLRNDFRRDAKYRREQTLCHCVHESKVLEMQPLHEGHRTSLGKATACDVCRAFEYLEVMRYTESTTALEILAKSHACEPDWFRQILKLNRQACLLEVPTVTDHVRLKNSCAALVLMTRKMLILPDNECLLWKAHVLVTS